MWDEIYPYNCLEYNFGSALGLAEARKNNPSFDRMVGLILPKKDGGITVLAFGWWNNWEADSLPRAIGHHSSLYTTAASLLARQLEPETTLAGRS
ncbi:MAG: hypothetical protein HY918_05045 [Candidatus Doudnabacteria bacterium]|nr:hypothetical protein [Candidatus Doudnabacteria bacterium]